MNKGRGEKGMANTRVCHRSNNQFLLFLSPCWILLEHTSSTRDKGVARGEAHHTSEREHQQHQTAAAAHRNKNAQVVAAAAAARWPQQRALHGSRPQPRCPQHPQQQQGELCEGGDEMMSSKRRREEEAKCVVRTTGRRSSRTPRVGCSTLNLSLDAALAREEVCDSFGGQNGSLASLPGRPCGQSSLFCVCVAPPHTEKRRGLSRLARAAHSAEHPRDRTLGSMGAARGGRRGIGVAAGCVRTAALSSPPPPRRLQRRRAAAAPHHDRRPSILIITLIPNTHSYPKHTHSYPHTHTGRAPRRRRRRRRRGRV